MGNRKSSSSSKPAESPGKAATEPMERAQVSPQSESDPAVSNMTRSFGRPHAVSSGDKGKRPSKGSLYDMAVDNDDDNNEGYEEDKEDKEDENKKPKMTKRHSSSSHTNVYTECGRHGDDWLFGGISDAVKSVFGKSEKK